jgi:hypothetical protein
METIYNIIKYPINVIYNIIYGKHLDKHIEPKENVEIKENVETKQSVEIKETK